MQSFPGFRWLKATAKLLAFVAIASFAPDAPAARFVCESPAAFQTKRQAGPSASYAPI